MYLFSPINYNFKSTLNLFMFDGYYYDFRCLFAFLRNFRTAQPDARHKDTLVQKQISSTLGPMLIAGRVIVTLSTHRLEVEQPGAVGRREAGSDVPASFGTSSCGDLEDCQSLWRRRGPIAGGTTCDTTRVFSLHSSRRHLPRVADRAGLGERVLPQGGFGCRLVGGSDVFAPVRFGVGVAYPPPLLPYNINMKREGGGKGV